MIRTMGLLTIHKLTHADPVPIRDDDPIVDVTADSRKIVKVTSRGSS